MKFLNDLCQRPDNEKPVMIIPVGYPSASATIPQAAKKKKPLGEKAVGILGAIKAKKHYRYRGRFTQVEFLPPELGFSSLI